MHTMIKLVALLACLAVSARPARADYEPPFQQGYMPALATNFTSCPYMYEPPAYSATLGDELVDVPDETFDVATWSKTGAGAFNWIFVSTGSGVRVLDGLDGFAQHAMPFFMNKTFGIDTVAVSSTSRRLWSVAKSTDGTDALVVTATVSSATPWTATNWSARLMSLKAPDGYGHDIYACSGTTSSSTYSSNDPLAPTPGSFDVLASTATPGLAFVLNECTKFQRGTVDVVKLVNGQATVVQRVLVDSMPAGMALGSGDSVLYVTNEGAGPLSLSKGGTAPNNTPGSHVGALMVFDVTPNATDGRFLNLRVAVNAGCAPVRVVADNASPARVWVSSRFSNELQVFQASKLTLSEQATSRMARVRTGTEPVGIKLVDNGNGIAVANSFRTWEKDDSQHIGDSAWPTTTYPAPTLSVYKVTQVVNPTFETKVHSVPPCLNRITGGVRFGFPRNLAADADNLYLTLYSWGMLQVIDMRAIEDSLDACD